MRPVQQRWFHQPLMRAVLWGLGAVGLGLLFGGLPLSRDGAQLVYGPLRSGQAMAAPKRSLWWSVPPMPRFATKVEIRPPGHRAAAPSPRRTSRAQRRRLSSQVSQPTRAHVPLNPKECGLSQAIHRFYHKGQKRHVLLETDKPLYRPGETIWFRALSYREMDRKQLTSTAKQSNATPASIRIGFRCALLDPRGVVVAQRMLPLKGGLVAGQFALPSSASGGVYTLRLSDVMSDRTTRLKLTVQAYQAPRIYKRLRFLRKGIGPGEKMMASLLLRRATGEPFASRPVTAVLRLDGRVVARWTQRTGPEGLALIERKLPSRSLAVRGLLTIQIRDGGVTESISRPIPLAERRLRVGFFPEGGASVVGLTSRVYFAARRRSNGEPIDIQGHIVERNPSGGRAKARIAIKSIHDGMGHFVYTPRPHTAYVLVITRPVGIAQRFALPVAKASGVTLQHLGTRDTKKGRLSLLLGALRRQRVFVTAMQRERLLAARAFQLAPGQQRVVLPLPRNRRGIIRLTVWNEQLQPMAERLIFRRQGALTISIVPDRADYTTRQKVSLRLQVKDTNGAPVSGALLGVSVVDERVLGFADDHEPKLLAQRFFGGRLTGTIYRPNRYFEEKDPARAAAMFDLVMATHGWRGFGWSKISLGRAPAPVKSLIGWRHQQRMKAKKAFVAAFETIVIDGHLTASFPAYAPKPNAFVSRTNVAVRLPTIFRRPAKMPKPRAPARRAGRTVIVAKTRTPPRPGAEKTRLRGAYVHVKKVRVGDRVYRKKVVFNFSGDTIQGDLIRPDGAYVMARRRARYNSLITIPKERWLRRHWWIWKSARRALKIRLRQRRVRLSGKFHRQEARWYKVNRWSTAFFRPPVDARTGKKNLLSHKSTRRYGGRFWRRWHRILASMKPDEARRRWYAWSWWKVQFYRKHDKSIGLSWDRTRVFPVRFYSKTTGSKRSSTRKDMRETVYWNPGLKTDEKGLARVSFGLSDRVTAYRIRASGLWVGRLAVSTARISARRRLFFTVKAPLEVSSGDALALPVTLRNRSAGLLSVRIKARFSRHLKLLAMPWKETIRLRPWESQTAYIPLRVVARRGTARIDLSAQAGRLEDRYTTSLRIRPRGYERAISVAGIASGAQARKLSFMLPKDLKEAVPDGTLRLYSNPMSSLEQGQRGLLQEPHGCFEQASSANYPNVMLLKYLQRKGRLSQRLRLRSARLLAAGYKRLAGYETTSRGFEWFGRTPPHEALTAYGLMQFVEMKEVYDGVSPALLKRTRQWLLSRRDGRGGFLRSHQRLDSFGRAPADITNAYITFALTEAGETGFGREVSQAIAVGLRSKDTYLLALTLNIAANAKRGEATRTLLARLLKQQLPSGGFRKAKTSITGSRGRNLAIETTALALLGMLKAKAPSTLVFRSFRWLAQRRDGRGRFGTTQATVLALKAVMAHEDAHPFATRKGKAYLVVNQRLQVPKPVSPVMAKASVWRRFSSKLRPGLNQLSLTLPKGSRVPFALGLRYTTRRPRSHPDAAVAIQTRLLRRRATMGQVVSLRATIQNRARQKLPMILAKIAFPGGLRLQMWQLKKMRKSGSFAYFETRPRAIWIYLMGMKPRAKKQLRFDLIAHTTGHFNGPASEAYLYYTDDQKSFAPPLQLQVMP